MTSRNYEYKKPDASLSAGEQAMLNRRIARSVKYGMSIKEASRHYRLDHRRITEICQAHNVAVPKTGQRGAGMA